MNQQGLDDASAVLATLNTMRNPGKDSKFVVYVENEHGQHAATIAFDTTGRRYMIATTGGVSF